MATSKGASKPPPLPVIAENIPEALRRLDRWVCWSWLWDPKKDGGRGGWTKPPLNAHTGRKASSTNKATWAPFDVALRAHQQGDFDGVGITLGELGTGQT